MDRESRLKSRLFLFLRAAAQGASSMRTVAYLSAKERKAPEKSRIFLTGGRNQFHVAMLRYNVAAGNVQLYLKKVRHAKVTLQAVHPLTCLRLQRRFACRVRRRWRLILRTCFVAVVGPGHGNRDNPDCYGEHCVHRRNQHRIEHAFQAFHDTRDIYA
jgi:hypothetical protein